MCLAAGAGVCPALTEDPLGVWLDVPFVPQKKEGCGAAALAMVMQYWSEKDGRPAPAAADADAIYRALHSSEAKGIVAADLIRYLEQAGYRAIAFAGERQDLRQHLAKGRPLIVALKPGRSAALHYVVVVGVDEGQSVLVNDPAGKKLERIAWFRFEAQWRAMQRWTLLALPPPNP